MQNKMKAQKAPGKKTDQFFDSLNEPIATLACALRSLIRDALPAATESIKWGMPVYENGRLICAVRPGRDYVALQFYTAGTTLRDPDGLLEGTGKQMRHVKIRSRAEVKKRLFASWLKQAAQHDSGNRKKTG